MFYYSDITPEIPLSGVVHATHLDQPGIAPGMALVWTGRVVWEDSGPPNHELIELPVERLDLNDNTNQIFYEDYCLK